MSFGRKRDRTCARGPEDVSKPLTTGVRRSSSRDRNVINDDSACQLLRAHRQFGVGGRTDAIDPNRSFRSAPSKPQNKRSVLHQNFAQKMPRFFQGLEFGTKLLNSAL